MSDDARSVYLEILRTALMLIRVLGNKGKGVECAIEAYHVHNIPDLLKKGDSRQEDYYLEVERPRYLQQVGADGERTFGELWRRLEQLKRASEAERAE